MSLYAPGFLLRSLARQRVNQIAFVNTVFGDSYSGRRRLHVSFLSIPLPHRILIDVQYDGRNRLSKFWTPTGGIAKEDNERG